MDDVAPSQARLKLYFQTPHTSFNSVLSFMSLGGLTPLSSQQTADLRSLVAASLGANFPDDQEVPYPAAYHPAAEDNFVELPILLAGYLYYFDIAPGHQALRADAVLQARRPPARAGAGSVDERAWAGRLHGKILGDAGGHGAASGVGGWGMGRGCRRMSVRCLRRAASSRSRRILGRRRSIRRGWLRGVGRLGGGRRGVRGGGVIVGEMVLWSGGGSHEGSYLRTIIVPTYLGLSTLQILV